MRIAIDNIVEIRVRVVGLGLYIYMFNVYIAKYEYSNIFPI